MTNTTRKVNLKEKLTLFNDHWQPRIVANYNNNDIFVVKVEGAFNWHSHADTDDFFLVIDGEVDIEMRDQTVTLGAGEMYVVPAGVEHRPVAKNEAHLMLIEPIGTPNTGDQSTAAAKVRI